MSTGTNKERIEQNNELLNQIKTTIDNLPSAGSTSGVKLFETEQAMQADTTAKENDLAVVYRNDIKSVSNGDTITSITFPRTVIFTEAITSSYYGRLRNRKEPRIYLDIQLDASRFMLFDMNNTIREIEYSSTDGITYTRTDSNEDTYEIGETIVQDLDEHICKFMQVGGNVFEGLYKYTSYQLLNLILYNLDINNYDFNNKVYTGNKTYQNNLQDAFNIIHENYDDDITILFLTSDLQYGYAIRGGNKPNGSGGGGMSNVLQYFNNKMYKVTGDSVTDKTYIVLYKFNMSDSSLVETTDISSTQTTSPFKYNRGVTPLPEDATCFIITTKDNDFASIKGYNDSNSETEITVLSKEYTTDYKYKLASTQLSLSNVNQLLPGKIAYGSNGIITGDEAIYDNLDMALTTKHLLPGIPTDSTSNHAIKLDSRYIRKNK